MQWWLDFLPSWSETSLILESNWTPSTNMQLLTDLSGTNGWDAYWSGKWLRGQWSEAQLQMDITWKELFAVVMPVHTWEMLWQRQNILIHCDNLAVVTILESGSTCAKETMALVCLSYHFAARYNINICIVHIAGMNNVIADYSSCFNRTSKQVPATGPTGKPNTRYHPCVADAVFHRCLLQCCYFGVAQSTRRTNQSGFNVFIMFFSQFDIPASSVILEYFCVHPPQHVSYKALKVYLSSIRAHIEQGSPDPTESATLHLVRRGIHREQGDNQRTRLPITINLLRTP